MTVILSLPTETETKLRQRAQAAGQDVNRYVEELISRELTTPATIAEAAEPFARAVEAAGVTDEEFLAVINEAITASRRDRRNKAK